MRGLGKVRRASSNNLQSFNGASGPERVDTSGAMLPSGPWNDICTSVRQPFATDLRILVEDWMTLGKLWVPERSGHILSFNDDNCGSDPIDFSSGSEYRA